MDKTTIGTLRKRYNYNNNYNKEHFDRVSFVVPQGEKEKLEKIAATKGMKLGTWIKEVIYREIEKD